MEEVTTIKDLLTKDNVKQVVKDLNDNIDDIDELIIISTSKKDGSVTWQTTHMFGEQFLYLIEMVKHWHFQSKDENGQS